MNVAALNPGDLVYVVYPGHDDGPVTDYEHATFLAWSTYGISVLAHGIDHFVGWQERRYVADPRTGAAVTRPVADEVLPTTVPDLE